MSHTSHSLSKGRRSNVGLFLLSGNSPTKESMMKNLTHAELVSYNNLTLPTVKDRWISLVA
ncbi:hypothetical protein ACU6TM_16730, partial [Acinetobacter baumannii]